MCYCLHGLYVIFLGGRHSYFCSSDHSHIDQCYQLPKRDAVHETEVKKCVASQANNEEQDDCFILSGSKVPEGVGHALVIAVGTNAFYDKTMMALWTNNSGGNGPQQQRTPLQLNWMCWQKLFWLLY